jgi:16S rRNA (guanine527-N7)-methyltransferase
LNDLTGPTLADALTCYECELPTEQVAQLDRYCRLLWDWNRKLNLTRHTDYNKFVRRDVWDSLQLSHLLQPNEEVLDVGTGGGVPGIILAILRTDLQIAVCESIGKKARAVEAMIDELDLPVTVYPDRAEDVLEDFRFDTLVARAVGPLVKIGRWFAPHWHAFGRLLAIKGPSWEEEYQTAREHGLLNKVSVTTAASYRMPGTDSHSVILQLRSG